MSIFSPYNLGPTTLKNRIIMAPMTRSRAIGNLPNPLMAEYYAQRATAGLIITEGVSPSPNGLGYARIPGAFLPGQTSGWKLITKAVHDKGGKIFMQLMHTGRIGHVLNLPAGAKVLGPSAVIAPGKMWTDQEQMQDQPIPHPMNLQEIEETKAEYVQAAKNAIEAGFDGVELHSANGYLLEQFLSPHSNLRADSYGGSIVNRSRFVLEVAAAVADGIGKDKTAIRLSPFGVFNDMPAYAEINDTYTYLAEQLNNIAVVYIHLVDHSAQGAPEVPFQIKRTIREKFKNTLILSGGYDVVRAEKDIVAGNADLIAFGKPFINNPDLVERMQKGLSLSNHFDATTLYTPGAKGYSDYPTFVQEPVTA